MTGATGAVTHGAVTHGAGRRRAALTGAVVAVLALTGCGTSGAACPAVGWQNTLTVQFDGAGAGVTRVQLCTDEGCAPAAYGTVAAPPGLGVVTAQRRDADTWTFTLDTTPPQLTVRPFGTGDAALAETAVTPAWQRADGTDGADECGGPHAAEVVARA